MAQQVQSVLPSLYLELSRYGQSGEYEKALKTIDKILQESPGEEKALQCKVVSLIHLGKFKEAIDTINKNAKNIGDVVFEKAYCHYRLNDVKEALKVLNNVSNPSFRMKELKAQVLYRLEKYQECFEAFKDLIKNSEDEYEEERETNLAAVIAGMSADTKSEVKGASELRDHTYELCYNKACILLGQEKYVEARKMLNAAEELCKKTLEEDEVPEEDIEEELGIVRTQKGYIEQMLRHPEQALRLYNQVLKQRPSDNTVVAVASNNIVTMNKDQNVFDSKKKMKLATADGLESKMTSRQLQAICLNHCLLLYHTGQAEQCWKLLHTLEKKYSHAADQITLLKAALHCKEKRMSKAVDMLKEHASKHPDQSLAISFTLAQLLLTQGHVNDACNVLRSLGDVSYKPGVVSALVTLYQSLEDKESAVAVLNEAVAWHRKNKVKSPECSLLARESSKFYLKNGNFKEASALLEDLRKNNPDDPRILAQLISAYSSFNPKKAREVSKDLPPVEEITRKVDVESLETTSWTMGAKYVKKTGKLDASPANQTEDIVKKKRKKRKKGKLPKNYDPNVDPDPERWLPRRERSTFKKRKDRRGGASGGVGKGTQGAVGAVGDIDATKTTQKTTPLQSPAPVAQPSPNPPGPRQQRPQPIQKKKKKKGGRW